MDNDRETAEETRDRATYEDLAERICAAWMSHQQGLAAVDYMLKRLRRDRKDGGVHQSWIQIAKMINRSANESVVRLLSGLPGPG